METQAKVWLRAVGFRAAETTSISRTSLQKPPVGHYMIRPASSKIACCPISAPRHPFLVTSSPTWRLPKQFSANNYLHLSTYALISGSTRSFRKWTSWDIWDGPSFNLRMERSHDCPWDGCGFKSCPWGKLRSVGSSADLAVLKLGRALEQGRGEEVRRRSCQLVLGGMAVAFVFGGGRLGGCGVKRQARGTRVVVAMSAGTDVRDVRRMKVEGCDVYLPGMDTEEKGLVHFLPGAVVSTAPSVFYGSFLEQLSSFGYVVIATPYDTGFDHRQLGSVVAEKFNDAYSVVLPNLPSKWLPTFGIGHSLGAKLHVLLNSDPELRKAIMPRVSNVLISYNNYDANESIPAYQRIVDGLGVLDRLDPLLTDLGLSQQAQAFGGVDIKQILRNLSDLRNDMTPSRAEFEQLLQNDYGVIENLVVSFNDDTIDQSDRLEAALRVRHSTRSTMRRFLPGSHLTPMTPDFGDQLRSLGLGETLDNLVQSQARVVRDKYQNELASLVKVIVAYLMLRTEDIFAGTLGPARD